MRLGSERDLAAPARCPSLDIDHTPVTSEDSITRTHTSTTAPDSAVTCKINFFKAHLSLLSRLIRGFRESNR